ncbi:uncharacterized protein E0L32_008963 [Thyridium curvatum]|uniref:TM7S3/TM198-like domain-containing protein n=1 Tax=Thyridium curvatum TaxID=1093900 RepID=A0A507AJW8_9PEZI|nr:uncharacterized protein E0L32_008963 [Thyridium curvatum]TPX09772.1 hypothetical protein E0L32_008963 [Thyridium curvatum]
MLARGVQMRALVCLCLCFNLIAAGLLVPVRRADPTPTPADAPATLSGSGRGDETPSSSPSVTEPPRTTSGEAAPAVEATSNSTTTSSTRTSAPVPGATAVNGTDAHNQTLFNTTIAAGELPLQPVVTPGWAVAGVFMLCTGVVYTLVGIKTQWLHTYFSTAFLASLGTTVLIVYVMTPPVSPAIQGAYVVAVVLTGAILGGAAIVFKEITEGLGCFLGGFSLSMWLLSLKDGGLVTGTGAKVGFIAAFSLAAFALYFSHYTRERGLIVCISFAGATVTVLGIDAFSRAGLKEFWAYIWDLNGNLFPLGADTYPLTKGIKVELAATVIICLAGIVSQLKLWKIVKERRSKKEETKAENQRQLQEEETQIGRQVEARNARERDEWEAVYGDGERAVQARNPSSDSGVGDMESEKKHRDSQGTATMRSRHFSVTEEEIELHEIPLQEEAAPAVPPKPKAAAELVMEQDQARGVVTVRVAKDDIPEGLPARQPEDEEPKVWYVGADGEARRSSASAKRASRTSTGPEVVPLPFRVPHVRDADETSQADRSSVATFADEDALSGVASKRNSFAKRLSRGSAELLRSMSQRSKRDNGEKSPLPNEVTGESREDLFVSRNADRDDSSSIAATIDGISSDGDAYTVRDGGESRSIEINAQLAEIERADQRGSKANKDLAESNKLALPTKDKRVSAAETVATDILNTSEGGESTRNNDNTCNTERATETPHVSDSDAGTRKAKSVNSVVSTPASLTREHLPRSLSRIAMSYRTNEWAKHLSNAETPAPETLQLSEYVEEAAPSPTMEPAAPVNVEELQLTAENAAPAPAAPRSATAMSQYPSTASLPAQALSRSNSKQSMLSIPASQSAEQLPISSGGLSPTLGSRPGQQQAFPNPYRSHSGAMNRRTSNLSVHPIAEEAADSGQVPDSPGMPLPDEGNNSGNTSMSPSPVPPETSAFRAPVPGVVSYSSPQTLIGKRELFLRSKSQGSLVGPSPIPESMPMPTIPSAANSDAGSVYNMPAGPYGTSFSSQHIDVDDMPLSHRKEILRQSSLAALSGASSSRPPSQMSFATAAPPPPPIPAAAAAPLLSIPAASADSIPFNSHQPKRASGLPSQAAREAQLAQFRSSVAAELRAGTPIVPTTASGSGRETPLLTGLLGSVSQGGLALPLSTAGRDSEVRRGIDAQRSMLMGQKEAEAQRREMERLAKERGDRAFEESMRRGELLEAHQDAMRRMQAKARGR